MSDNCNQVIIMLNKLDYLNQVHCQCDKLNELCIRISYETWLNKIYYNNYCVNKK
jgi:hypothetical protein